VADKAAISAGCTSGALRPGCAPEDDGRVPPDYQILTLFATLEALAPPEKSPELARLANDGMAEICAAHPKRFPGWVASLPMNSVPECLKEMERTIEKMGARGIQIFTNVNGRPLDEPEFAPIFERMHAYDLPIWLHPTRGPSMTDYASEKTSKFEIWFRMAVLYQRSVRAHGVLRLRPLAEPQGDHAPHGSDDPGT
jgi:predicted TIM-barrel fold metal-dependent hydrolase